LIITALAAVLLLLAGCVVLLFAMFGELAQRVAMAGETAPAAVVRPLEEARIGASPTSWPEPIASLLEERDGSVLLPVLSTACGSCEKVARQLATEDESDSVRATAIIISCGDRSTGEEFVRRHGLGHLRTYVDEGGTWVNSSFGVEISPTALVIREKKLQTALVFTDVPALRTATSDPREVLV
jgi:hypothetical protein